MPPGYGRRPAVAGGNELLALGRRAIALLPALVERASALVSKVALIKAAWANQAVEDINFTVPIAALRPMFGETAGGAETANSFITPP